MARIWNPTEEKVSTMIQGAWFTFAPGSFKTMDETKARFIESNRKESGLVTLDNRFDPISENHVENFEKTEEGKAILLHKREEGVTNLINHHMDIIRNNQVCLRQDLAHKYPTADAEKMAALNASKAEIDSMRIVAKYKKRNGDNAAKQVDEVKKLMEEIGPFSD